MPEVPDPEFETPFLGGLSGVELRDLVDKLQVEEVEISYRRRILHGKLDLLRAEMVARLRNMHADGRLDVSSWTLEQIAKILLGRPHG